MKDRIVLFTIFFGLGIFLYIFQNYFNTVWGLFFLVCGMFVYAIYMNLATKHKKRKLLKNPPQINENYKPFVTIMVPAHNEDRVITSTAENILKLDYPNFELILIDDRSEDNTARVIQDLEQRYDKIKAFVRDKDAFPGKSAVLNDALEFAKGEAILVFDADARVESDFLSKLVPNLEPEDVGAVQARKVISNKDFNFLTRCQNNEYTMDTHFQVGRDSVKGAVELRGNGELIKRTALEDIGGWNNYTITDDLDMSTRMHIKGWDVRFCQDAKVYEEGVMYLIPLFRQRRRWLEGSIRRYLEQFSDVLNSKEMSLRASLDMTAYISQFIMPLWLLMEVLLRSFKFAMGKIPPNAILSSLIIGAAISICFTLASVYSLRRYDSLSRFQAFKQGIETSLYIVTIWFPMVMFICFKILFCKKNMNWGKTSHGLILEEESNLKLKEEKELQEV